MPYEKQEWEEIMGADGSIWIYDLEKLKLIIPERPDEFTGGYTATIYGHKVLIHYEDNQWYEGHCIICNEFGCNNEEHYNRFKLINQSDALVCHSEVWT